MKKVKLFSCIALFVAISIGAFSAYNYSTMSAKEMAILNNVEALTLNEDGGVNLVHCISKNSSGSLGFRPACHEYTVVTYNIPSAPVGTIYPCEGEIMGSHISYYGYCYKRAQ